MSLANVLLERARAAVRDDGVLSLDELRALMQQAWDRERQSVHDEATRALLYIRWHYWKAADAAARKLLDGFAEAAFADHPELLVWVADTFAPGGPNAAPAGAPPLPRPTHDERLIGTWTHQQHTFGGDTTLTTYRYRVFGPDGRFGDLARSTVTTTFRDSSGSWAGWSDAATKLEPSKRGTWATIGPNLLLRRDDGGALDYRYELGGDSLLLIPARGENELWKR
jgi:hypothetical protein